MKNYLTLENFASKEDAEKLSELLFEIGIDNILVEDPTNLDSNFVGVRFGNSFFIKIDGKDFEKARTALEEHLSINIEELDENYFMFQFTIPELQDVVAKPDEWGYYNCKLAKLLLAKKGVLNTDKIEEIKFDHRNAIVSGKNADPTILFIAYSFMLLWLFIPILWYFEIIGNFGYTLLPPWVTLLMGWSYAFSKKTAPDGSRNYNFNPKTRMHGFIIFYASIIGLILVFIVFKYALVPLNLPLRF